MSSARPICGQVSAFYGFCCFARGDSGGVGGVQSGICSEFGVFVLLYFVFVLVYLCICVYVLVCLYVVLLVYIFTRGGSGWSEARNLLGI